MNTHLNKRMAGLRRRAESGFTVTIQAIYYVLLLFFFFALIFDLGGAGYVYSISSNAVRMAAQDAAKNIDEQAFLTNQEVRLSNDALARAQALVSGMTGGHATITSLTINHQLVRDVIVVRANATASLPVLGSLCGLESVTIPVEGYAEPAYGISREGQ
jgi:hypothetical protein